MPTVTLGRKRPSEAIVDSSGGPKNKKIKFTDDGNPEAVPFTTNTTKTKGPSPKKVESVSKVKPDYAKFTRKEKKSDKSPQNDSSLAPNGSENRSGTNRSISSSALLVPQEIDFPRGGGSSFTPLEHKELRAEGFKEAENEIFKVI